MKNRKITPKQERFCQEYLIDLNASQAAIRAGYSRRAAKEQGCRLLATVRVQAEIEKLMAERSERAKVRAVYVLQRLKSIVERCMQSKPVLDKNGKQTGQYTFNASGAIRALELLGKHLDLFVDRHQHEGKEPTLGQIMAKIYRGRQLRQAGGSGSNGKKGGA